MDEPVHGSPQVIPKEPGSRGAGCGSNSGHHQPQIAENDPTTTRRRQRSILPPSVTAGATLRTERQETGPTGYQGSYQMNIHKLNEKSRHPNKINTHASHHTHTQSRSIIPNEPNALRGMSTCGKQGLLTHAATPTMEVSRFLRQHRHLPQACERWGDHGDSQTNVSPDGIKMS